MAKGNMFQGMARGKVGDVVFYRMNGVQMSRVRNRTPKNPRTNEQLYQRAIIATVMKMYSVGKEIFDHSFQGYTVGEGCMRRFNSVNARILRSQIVNDIDLGLAEAKQHGRVVSPKSLYYTPIINCQISEGTLSQNLWNATFTTHTNTIESVSYKFNKGSFTGVEDKVVDLLASLSIYAGDIFTWCFGILNTSNVYSMLIGENNEFSTQYESAFQWIRLTVKSSIPEDLKIASAKITDVFDIEMSNGPLSMQNGAILESTGFYDVADGWEVVTHGVIRSREDVDLRSTSYMYVTGGIDYGIASKYLLNHWAEEVTKIGESELILEGGDSTTVNAAGKRSIEDELIIPADVNEAPVPTTARHRGTTNPKRG